MDNRQKVPILRSLIRPHLLFGGERELMMCTVMLTVPMMAVQTSLLGAAVGLFVLGAFVTLFRMVAKHDPHMSKVYIRQLRYKQLYIPHPRLSTPIRDLKVEKMKAG